MMEHPCPLYLHKLSLLTEALSCFTSIFFFRGSSAGRILSSAARKKPGACDDRRAHCGIGGLESRPEISRSTLPRTG
jgi:hypothetical protein